MRGEVVQVLGAGREGLICLPGTHSKWVEVRVARMMDPGALRPDAFRAQLGITASALDPLAGTRALFMIGSILSASECS